MRELTPNDVESKLLKALESGEITLPSAEITIAEEDLPEIEKTEKAVFINAVLRFCELDMPNAENRLFDSMYDLEQLYKAQGKDRVETEEIADSIQNEAQRFFKEQFAEEVEFTKIIKSGKSIKPATLKHIAAAVEAALASTTDRIYLPSHSFSLSEFSLSERSLANITSMESALFEDYVVAILHGRDNQNIYVEKYGAGVTPNTKICDTEKELKAKYEAIGASEIPTEAGAKTQADKYVDQIKRAARNFCIHTQRTR